jgi:DnaJ-class molecular chaperone
MFQDEIIICDKCKGFGKIQCDELEDYHSRERKYWDEVCKNCQGTGRRLKMTKIYIVNLPEKYLTDRPKEK